MDTNYWNNFYTCSNQDMDMCRPSPFAQYVLPHLTTGGKLLELGCGNGRDCTFFANQGIHVTALDMSEIAVSSLQNREVISGSLQVFCDDFVCSVKLVDGEYDYVYSRFTLHSINEEQENQLLQNVFVSLKEGGKFFIEVRSILDDIYGLGEQVGRNSYIYNDHFRRFIVLDELIQKMLEVGYVITLAEEKRGFAPFKNEDPIVIRVIAEKNVEQTNP